MAKRPTTPRKTKAKAKKRAAPLKGKKVSGWAERLAEAEAANETLTTQIVLLDEQNRNHRITIDKLESDLLQAVSTITKLRSDLEARLDAAEAKLRRRNESEDEPGGVQCSSTTPCASPSSPSGLQS